MSGNNLTLVATGAFRDVELSATLDLSDNAQRIASIESHAFAGSAVDKLDLHGSSIDRSSARAEWLVHNDDTVEQGRGLSFVGSGALSNLTRASGAAFALVDLSDNSISTVEDGSFATLRAANLDMSGNSLTLVATGAFRDVELSATLDLSDNAQRIASIESRLRGQRGRQARPARLVDRPPRGARAERARTTTTRSI